MRELIDTLWNVNESPSLHISERSRELIDTLWNVNFTCFAMRRQAASN